MKVEEEIQFLLAKFCSKDEMLKYFFQFRDKIKELKDRIPIQNFADFLKVLQLFEKYNFLKKNNSVEDVSSVKEVSINSEIFAVLISCLDIIVYKIAKLHFEMLIDALPEDCFETETTFDAVICLLRILILEIKGKNYFEDLLSYLTNFFTGWVEQNKFSSVSNMGACPVYDYSLKFIMRLLKCVPVTDHLKYITYETSMKLFCALPLLDLKTSKFFLNHILPIITSFCNLSFIEDVLRSIWNLICSNYSYDINNCDDRNIGIYTLFYSLAENIYNDFSDNRTFYIHNNVSFWKMTLMGLTSRHSFITKRSLCIFKIFLFWVKTKNTNIVILDCGVCLFAVKSMKDLPVWNDVVTLFETLEEKQAHVIKPVLPKFLRIIQLTSICTSDVQHKNLILHTSWLMHLLKRMLNHENKYIVKWALSTAMNLDFQICPISQQNSKLFIQIILEAFNDQNLFSRTEGKDGYFRWLSAKKIQKFLLHYISVFETESERVDLMRNLLSIIACQSWCGVALLHFTFALSRMDSILAWNQKDLINMRKIILDLQRTQAQVFRAALEHCLLETCINFLDWNSISSNDLAELLMLFKTDVVLHSRPRNKLLMKLKDMFSSEAYKLTLNEAYKYCAECFQRIDASCNNADAGFEITCSSEMKKTVRISVLFLEAISSHRNKETCSNWYSLFKPIVCTLSSAHNRPYMSMKKFLTALQFIIILYQEAEGCLTDEKNNIYANILVENRTEFVEFMYQQIFINLKNDIDIAQSNIFFDALHLLSTLKAYKCAFYNNLPILLKKCEFLIEDSSLRKSQLLASCRILNFLFCHLPDTEQLMESRLDYHLLLNIMQENIWQFNLAKPEFVKNIEKNEWLEFTTKSVCDFWNVAILIIKYSSKDKVQNLFSVLADNARNTYEQGPVVALLPTLKCLKVLVSKFNRCSLHSVSDLLDTSWKACIELRGNEIFRPALKCFIEIVFQPDMLYFHDVLHEYTEKLQKLEENTVGVFYYLIKHFCNVFNLKALINSKFNSIPLLVQALTYGPIHHKGQRVMEETIAYIINLDNDLATSISDVSEPSFCVRIIAIDFLMKNLYHELGCDAKEKENFVLNLINSLIDTDISVNHTRTSRFVNSYSHRLRNRIWQVIIILQKNVHNIDNVEKLLLRVQTSLESDNQQPSVRYFEEWVIFNFLYSFNCLLSNFISVIEQSTEKRPGMIISLLSVLVLLILHDILKSKCDILRCFPIIINFCMAQNFTVRLYAQLALNKLFSLCQNENYSDIILKYDFILNIIESQNLVNGVGNFCKNIQKLSDDFYFSSFHPTEHLSFQTIFFHIPRLSNIAPDEWIKPSMIEKYIYSDLNYPISLYNCDEKLNNSIATSWSSKSNCEMQIDHYDSVDYNFQKKVCPWQDALSSENNDDLFGERKQKTSGDLIVVASLIDRIPNLGGLCRTCEVFGVSEFVIGCLKYTEDKQFQNLAVSSDKWVSIKEVKPYHLKEYLISLKEKGYSLIGAEQADDSHKLTNYKFPRKSVLLLGHEKEGLPVDFIQLLDDCVEIPQQGITRSLNVHVSGAILIWEYSRQHLYSS